MWNNDLQRLREIAAARLKAEPLQFWWMQKYNRPYKDPLLQTYTIEELQIEYLMYAIDEDPAYAVPKGANVQFRTGDKLIDKWEEQLAAGVDPTKIDWDEGVDADFVARMKSYSKRVAETHIPGINGPPQPSPEMKDVDLSELMSGLVGGFSDDYSKMKG